MKQAMIFAAGLGTRLKPLTDTMPKALVPVAGEPLLKHVIMRLKAEGFGRVVVNVHHFADQIVSYLNANAGFGLDLHVSDETERLLDTGGGIKKALPLFDTESPILIHNVDILSNARLSDLYDAVTESWYGGALLVSRRQTKRYLLFDEERLLQGWKNIETGETRGLADWQLQAEREGNISFTPLAFSGIHVMSPRAFPLFQRMPSRFGIIDFYLKYCGEAAFRGVEQSGLRLLDVGKLDMLDKADLFINEI